MQVFLNDFTISGNTVGHQYEEYYNCNFVDINVFCNRRAMDNIGPAQIRKGMQVLYKDCVPAVYTNGREFINITLDFGFTSLVFCILCDVGSNRRVRERNVTSNDCVLEATSYPAN